MSGRAVRIPARTRADIPSTVTVPAGDRAAEIVVCGVDGGVQRVGLRLRVTVPELSALTVEHVAVHGDHIAYGLANRGTTALVPRLAVRADGGGSFTAVRRRRRRRDDGAGGTTAPRSESPCVEAELTGATT